MKSRFLFPHRYFFIGLFSAIPSIILGLFVIFKDLSFDFLTIELPYKYFFSDNFIKEALKGNLIRETTQLNLTDEIATIGSIIGLIFIAFSKLKVEDEYVSKVRLESLQWAIYFNFGLLILATIFVHDMAYFNVLIFNMFTPLVFFIFRFYFILFLKPKFENTNSKNQ